MRTTIQRMTAVLVALGVPAVVQDTGFSHIIPTGEGLQAFTTLEAAADAIARLAHAPVRHAARSRRELSMFSR